MSMFLFFEGISCSENAFYPKRFPSHLYTSSELQSKYFKIIFVICVTDFNVSIFRSYTFEQYLSYTFSLRCGINAKTMSLLPTKRLHIYPPSPNFNLFSNSMLSGYLGVVFVSPTDHAHKNKIHHCVSVTVLDRKKLNMFNESQQISDFLFSLTFVLDFGSLIAG